jgi:hypothetical protein
MKLFFHCINILFRWIAELDTFSTKMNVIKMLVGNKIDREDSREVTRDEGVRFARKHSMLFIEASARTREGVQIAFEELVQKVFFLLISLISIFLFSSIQIIQTPSLWQKEPNSKDDTIHPNDLEDSNEYKQGCYC